MKLGISTYACAIALTLAGCSNEMQQAMQDGLRSGSALEGLAASGSPFASQETRSVARSKDQVIAALESFSEQCLSVSVQYGRFPGDAAVQNDYVPLFTNEDAFLRHVLFRQGGGHSTVQLSDAGRGYNAAASTQIIPTGPNSTDLKITSTFGLSGYADAITNSVSGAGILCPNLP